MGIGLRDLINGKLSEANSPTSPLNKDDHNPPVALTTSSSSSQDLPKPHKQPQLQTKGNVLVPRGASSAATAAKALGDVKNAFTSLNISGQLDLKNSEYR